MCDIVITELISEFPELNYSISEDGMIYDSNMNELPEVITKELPCRVVFTLHNGLRKYRMLHLLLAKAFIPNPKNQPRVIHRDHDKTNNTLENLKWVSLKASHRHDMKVCHYYRVLRVDGKWFAKYNKPSIKVSKYEDPFTLETLGPFKTEREATIEISKLMKILYSTI